MNKGCFNSCSLVPLNPRIPSCHLEFCIQLDLIFQERFSKTEKKGHIRTVYKDGSEHVERHACGSGITWQPREEKGKKETGSGSLTRALGQKSTSFRFPHKLTWRFTVADPGKLFSRWNLSVLFQPPQVLSTFCTCHRFFLVCPFRPVSDSVNENICCSVSYLATGICGH